MASDELLQKLLRGGAMTLVIKMAAAGLGLVMFVALSRVMSVENFGGFGVIFSLATTLAVAGCFGRRAMLMRFAPAKDEESGHFMRTVVVRFGYGATPLGRSIAGIALAAAALLVAGGACMLIPGIAECQTERRRAHGGVTLAMLPRDVIRRLAMIGTIGGLLPAGERALSAGIAPAILGAMLAATIIGQAPFHPATRPWALLRARARYDVLAWKRVAVPLWGASIMQSAGPTLAVALAGLVLAPEAAPPLFAALRAAMLLELFPLASRMVAASPVSRRLHQGDNAGVQRICTMVTAICGLAALICFALFAFAGDAVMARSAPSSRGPAAS